MSAIRLLGAWVHEVRRPDLTPPLRGLRFLAACSLAFLALGPVWGQDGVDILSPTHGAQLSGPVEVVIRYDGPATITRTHYLLDGQAFYSLPGLMSKAWVDFGELQQTRMFQVALEDDQGQRVESRRISIRPIVVDLVETTRLALVPVLVKTPRNKAVLDLEQEDFQVFEDGVPLKIVSFSREQMPLDVVLLLDTSSSMRHDMQALKQATRVFVTGLSPRDQIALVSFHDSVEILQPFSGLGNQVLSRLEGLESLGETALFDALIEGTRLLESRSRGRRAIVLFTDGRDSIYESAAEKRRMFRKAVTRAQNAEAAVFAVGLGRKIQKEALDLLGEETGGRMIFARGREQLQRAFEDVLADLRSQYLLGVTPLADRPGFHELEVRVRKSRLNVFARKGYTIE